MLRLCSRENKESLNDCSKEDFVMNNIKTFIEEFCEEQELDYREDYSGRGNVWK